MTVAELDWGLLTALLTVALLLFALWIACVVRAVQLHRPFGMTGVCALFLLGSFVQLQAYMHTIDWHYRGYPPLLLSRGWAEVPAWLALALHMASALMLLFAMLDLRWVRFHRITALSVRDAVNSLPTGLCVYRPPGRVLLANDAIHRLSLSLCGRTVLNGAELWRMVHLEEPRGRFEVVTRESDPILTLPDGRSWCFRRREKELRGEKVWELTASEVTEEMALSARLRENNRRLELQRDRLIHIGELTKDTETQKSLLAAKVRIHDELGGSLLAAKRYLALSDPAGRGELLAAWEKSLRLLTEREEMPAAGERSYRAELRAAEDVGVRVTTEGELPLAEPALSVLRCAISECVTNTFRHAEGDALRIRVEESASGWLCRFTNNGRPPAGEVRETGGLGNLRRLCEGCGGTMRVESSPRFLLELTIPKEDGQHGL